MKAADSKYFIDLTGVDGVDANKLNITITKGNMTYLPARGITDVSVNGVEKLDATAVEAE